MAQKPLPDDFKDFIKFLNENKVKYSHNRPLLLRFRSGLRGTCPSLRSGHVNTGRPISGHCDITQQTATTR